MKRFACVLFFAVAFLNVTAGEGASCKAGAQVCLDNMVKKFVAMPWDGILVEGVAKGEDVVVKEVEANSPGQLADIRKGDVLASMNNVKLADLDAHAFNDLMGNVGLGEEVTYAVIRNGAPLTIKVKMAQLPEATAAGYIGRHMISGHSDKHAGHSDKHAGHSDSHEGHSDKRASH